MTLMIASHLSRLLSALCAYGGRRMVYCSGNMAHLFRARCSECFTQSSAVDSCNISYLRSDLGIRSFELSKQHSAIGAHCTVLIAKSSMYVRFSVCDGAESQRQGALLRWRVFYSVHIARGAFGTHGITDIPHQSSSL